MVLVCRKIVSAGCGDGLQIRTIGCDELVSLCGAVFQNSKDFQINKNHDNYYDTKNQKITYW